MATTDASLTGKYRTRFQTVMQFVEKFFPHGFPKKAHSKMTPRVRFDAIAVGTWRALQIEPTIEFSGPRVPVVDWLWSDDFFAVTTSSASNVTSRIERRCGYRAANEPSFQSSESPPAAPSPFASLFAPASEPPRKNWGLNELALSNDRQIDQTGEK